MPKTPLHLLWIPSWYTLEEDPIMGIFFQEQAACLKEKGLKVGMLYPEVRTLKHATPAMVWKNHFQTTFSKEKGILTYRLHGWNLFPKIERAQMHLWVRSAMHLMEQYVKREGIPDIIHAQSTLWGGIAARAISKKYQIPYIITEHRDGFLHRKVLSRDIRECWSTPVIQDTLDNASQVLAVSTALKDSLAAYTRNPTSAVLPCFVDTDFFTMAEPPLPRPPFRFLTIAKLVPSKSIDLLLRAFQSVLRHHPDATLEIGGYGVERDKLELLTDELGIRKSVTFLGTLSREETRDAYKRAHAFVLPTRWETFGVVFIEAMAAGLPIVTTRCGGPEDIVENDTGIMVPVGDLPAFAAAMENMIRNYSAYAPPAIRHKAISRFGKDAICTTLIDIYNWLHNIK